MIRIGICDDNSIMLHNLDNIISKAFDAHTSDFEIMTFGSGALLVNSHQQDPFHIIFLDIDMTKMTGFDVAKTLRDEFSNCFIIFVTSHSELMYESMDFQPFHFIKKNCDEPISSSVNRIVKKLMKHICVVNRCDPINEKMPKIGYKGFHKTASCLQLFLQKLNGTFSSKCPHGFSVAP